MCQNSKDYNKTLLPTFSSSKENYFWILDRVHGQIPDVNGFVVSLNPDLFDSLQTSLMSSPSVYFI